MNVSKSLRISPLLLALLVLFCQIYLETEFDRRQSYEFRLSFQSRSGKRGPKLFECIQMPLSWFCPKKSYAHCGPFHDMKMGRENGHNIEFRFSECLSDICLGKWYFQKCSYVFATVDSRVIHIFKNFQIFSLENGTHSVLAEDMRKGMMVIFSEFQFLALELMCATLTCKFQVLSVIEGYCNS